MTLAARARTQPATWPDLTEAEPSCGTGRALASSHAEIVHFHADRDVDLHLTARVVRQFEEHLTRAPAVALVPGPPWVTLHLDVAADVDLLMPLVSLALHAHQAEDAIRRVVERLVNAFSATHDPAEVEAAVAKAHASIADRPVREFVPVLVERKARSLLDSHG